MSAITADAKAVYDQLYAIYRELHDAFGLPDARANLGSLMKRLLAIKESRVHARA